MYKETRSYNTTTVLELSSAEPTHLFFRRPQLFETKLLCAVMFAFLPQVLPQERCCTQQCSMFLDCLALVGTRDWARRFGSFPHLHNTIAILQAAPETLRLRIVSQALGIWQFGWTLLQNFKTLIQALQCRGFSAKQLQPTDLILKAPAFSYD